MFKITRKYNASLSSSIVRSCSDHFSLKHCDMTEAMERAVEITNGRCAYCGEILYNENNEVYDFVHWDHIYPASKFNLFTRGNVFLSCGNCNTEKNNENPIHYYEKRLKAGNKVYLNSVAFKNLVKRENEIYYKDFPEFALIGSRTEDKTFRDLYFNNETLIRLFFEGDKHINIQESFRNIYHYEDSINASFYETLKDKIYEDGTSSYSNADLVSRIGAFNELFEGYFGERKTIQDVDCGDFKCFVSLCLNKKQYSRNEFYKYRRLLNKIIKVLNDEYSLHEGQYLPEKSKLDKLYNLTFDDFLLSYNYSDATYKRYLSIHNIILKEFQEDFGDIYFNEISYYEFYNFMISYLKEKTYSDHVFQKTRSVFVILCHFLRRFNSSFENTEVPKKNDYNS